MIRPPFFYALGLAIGLSLGMALIGAGMRQASQVSQSVVSRL
jgi:hypothetical protein